ncbi:hypothetical protein [Noviherbaspirillum pedocola]|uniref:Uncharacterized protein n=1 Tax=Noviherbaspirillum pedocola TaxID=2801341 RepID=A0A934VZP4_9BURK|nr:hypothetical protein [Noviherbaspirillum pedocola]MBK4733241.1 hypothetical protein [Noviherbaspirillum pedocola]
MSTLISSYTPTSSRNDDVEADEQRRRERELRMRKKADRQTMESYLELRKQELASPLHESVETSQGLLLALLRNEADEEQEDAVRYGASLLPRQTPVTKGDVRATPPASEKQSAALRERTYAPLSRPATISVPSDATRRAPMLPATSTNDASSKEQAAPSQAVPHAAGIPSVERFASLADGWDRMLDDLQLDVAGGLVSPEKMLGMLRSLQPLAKSIGSSAIDPTDARRIAGACHFLSAFVDSMSCDTSERIGLMRALNDSRQLIDGPHQRTASDMGGFDRLHPETGTEAESANDRKTLYAYLEILKSMASPVNSDANVSKLVARLADMQTSKPSAAMRRLAEQGDSSISLYADQIFRQLQELDAKGKSVRSPRLRMVLGTWLEDERKNMLAAIRHAEDIGAYISARRSRDEAHELERRAETMPLTILQKA